MLAGTSAPTTLTHHHHHCVQPLRTVIVSAQRHGLQSSNDAERLRRCTRCSAAVVAANIAAASVVDQPADNGLSMHPDAIRRRQEAEARREARKDEIAYAKTNMWWEVPGPDNLILATSEEMLNEAVRHGEQARQLVAIKFFAPWCQACKALYPKWMQLAMQNPDVTFVKVNAADDTMRAVAAAMGVTKLPYFHMYMHGQLAKNFTANLHKVSYLKRAISDCKQCLHPGCH
ncbi:hypothetical protein ABBQ32_006774 [Trebouxia sp. C0010 RCD-2024]